jgi:glycine hydroxymethyltransferase
VRKVTSKGEKIMYDFEEKINNAVFPGLQGGPHNNVIAGVATAMLQAASPEFRKYQERVLANAKQLAASLQKLGFKVITGGTDVHLVLVDVTKSFKVTGAKAAHVLELVSIACNKNTGGLV